MILKMVADGSVYIYTHGIVFTGFDRFFVRAIPIHFGYFSRVVFVSPCIKCCVTMSQAHVCTHKLMTYTYIRSHVAFRKLFMVSHHSFDLFRPFATPKRSSILSPCSFVCSLRYLKKEPVGSENLNI
jgi:hypothetical protein